MQELNIIVLVGTNPLPCYLAARQLIAFHRESRPEQAYRLWLIHSEENPSIRQRSTIRQARNILAALQKQKFISSAEPAELIALSDVSSPSAIRREVLSALTSRIKDDGDGPIPIHIDYTGGTKSMGVSVAQVADELVGTTAGFTFSYLDARSSTLVFDSREPQLYKSWFGVPDTGRSGDLRKLIYITVPVLLQLHDIVSGNSQEYRFEKTDAIMDTLIQSGSIDGFLKNIPLIRKLFGGSATSPNWKRFALNVKGFLQEAGGEEETLSITEEEACAVLKSPELGSLVTTTPGGKISFRSTFETVTSKNVKHALEYLDGHWLENYVYGICDEIKAQLGAGADVYEGVDARPMATRNSDAHSDIDVVFINGYQLTAISITTSSSRSVCKSKGFEVLLRASQLGGEESRSVLVTALSRPDAEGLEEDLRIVSGSMADHFLIVGKDDWKRPSLSNLLRNHIIA